MRTRGLGFTLIELLVVIAIIAILAAILFPIFISAREHAKQVQCLTNLGQLARAARQYADDWDSRLPVAWCGSSPPGTTDWIGWDGNVWKVPQSGQLYRYVKNIGVYQCPSDVGRPAPAVGGSKQFPSYSMNRSLSWRNTETMQLPGRADSGGTAWRSSKMLLFIHENRMTINDGNFEWPATWWDVPDNVHYDGTTVAFLDMHARWQRANWINGAIARGEYNPDYPRAPAPTPPGPL